jgi:uncharacterized BrkB/YihY/UPF0761 family membrane protein
MAVAVQTRAQDAQARLEAARPRVPAIDACFDLYQRDRERAGSLLGGALAFRLFLVLVPFTLVCVVISGMAADNQSEEEVAEHFGLTGLAAGTVSSASRLSTSSRWLVLAAGLIFLTYAAYSLVRALRTACAVAWAMPVL